MHKMPLLTSDGSYWVVPAPSQLKATLFYLSAEADGLRSSTNRRPIWKAYPCGVASLAFDVFFARLITVIILREWREEPSVPLAPTDTA